MISKIKLFAFLSFKNALKHKRKSFQIITIIAVITAFLFLYLAIIRGMLEDSVEVSVSDVSHISISYKGFYDRRELMPFDLSISNYQSILKELKDNYPSFYFYPFIQVPTVAYSDKSINILLQGGEFFDRDNLCPKYKNVLDRRMKEGRFFKDNSEKGVVLSAKSAKDLNVKIGDKVIFISYDAYGSFSAIELEVIGIYKSANKVAIVDMESAQKLLGIEGRTLQILTYIGDKNNASEALSKLEPTLSKYNLEGISWRKALGVMVSIIDFSYAFVVVLYLIFATVAIVGITNSVLISVFDRIREIGTLRAMGFFRGEVNGIIFSEILLLGLVGSLAGILIGSIFVGYLAFFGIPLSVYGEMEAQLESFGFIDVLWARFNIIDIVVSFSMGIFVPILASIYPLFVIRRMTVRELLGF